MTDILTTVLGLVKQTIGGNRNTWGAVLNANMDLVEGAVAGMTSKVVTGGSYTITDAERRKRVLNFTGALTADQTIVVANLVGAWIVRNATSGDFTLTIKTASGTAAEVPQGVNCRVWCDGSDVIYVEQNADLIVDLPGLINRAGEMFDYAGPLVPDFAYETDGSAKSRTTDVLLYEALTIRQTGTRASAANGIITGLASTTGINTGFYVSGSGIASGRRILSVDSATQITADGNNTGTGTAEVVVSPYPLGDGTTTFNIPNTTDTGRFRRSRQSGSTSIGNYQTNALKSHSHTGSVTVTGSGTTNSGGVDHSHAISGNTAGQNVDHTHGGNLRIDGVAQSGSGFANAAWAGGNQFSTGGTSNDHSHAINFTSAGASAYLHTHTFGFSGSGSFTTNNTGDTETRPEAIIVLTCVRWR